jgi:hypothetical protein
MTFGVLLLVTGRGRAAELKRDSAEDSNEDVKE